MSGDGRVDRGLRRRGLRRRGLFLGAATGVGAGLLACGPSATESRAPGATTAPAPTGGTARRLRIGVSFEVSNLSPFDNGFWLTSYGTGQSLYRVTPEDKIVPWIAQSITPDGQEGYTIKLDPRARFHNGKPIDARAVPQALERHIQAGTVNVVSLKGAAWEVLDATTLRVRTSQPDPWLPNFLALGYMPIFDPDEVPDKADPATLVGKGYFSGPFRVTRLTPPEMTMDAVTEAWDGAPQLAGVDVKFIKDPQARIAALQTGEIDMMLYVPADAIPLIKNTRGLHFKATPGASRIWVALNHARPPFNDLAVRQALALAIDRRQIAEHVLNGAYAAPDGLYPPAMPWTIPGLLKTDPGGARRLLEDAGWLPGADGVRVKGGQRLSFELMHYPQQPDAKPMAEAMQAQLRAAGMEVRLRQVDDINAAFASKEFDAGLAFNSMQQVGNPMTVLNNYFRTDSPRNYGAWGSPGLDRLIQQLNVEFDATRRVELLKDVQEIFRRDVPITFTVSRQWAVVVNDAFAAYVPTHDVDHYIVTKDVAPAARK
ncbi:MAG TPA: ABC transporter substrate-binding protein [Chloroflexota bacterium]|nr:ABC transporter substrate-binding protein [Chloroflexota bacterium]